MNRLVIIGRRTFDMNLAYSCLVTFNKIIDFYDYIIIIFLVLFTTESDTRSDEKEMIKNILNKTSGSTQKSLRHNTFKIKNRT